MCGSETVGVARTDAAMPLPREITRGTVTGPVVTAPMSQARPRMSLRVPCRS